jgi:hypothetical protein
MKDFSNFGSLFSSIPIHSKSLRMLEGLIRNYRVNEVRHINHAIILFDGKCIPQRM